MEQRMSVPPREYPRLTMEKHYMIMGSILVVVAGVAVLLVTDALGRGKALGCVAKMIASTAFLALAVHRGALDTPYGCGLLAGLFLSWWGDLFLFFREPRVFLAGLVSFLLGHVAYVTAFLLHGIAISWTLGAAAALVNAAIPVILWLAPNLGNMRAPVYAYIVVISLMVAFSAGAVGRGGATPMVIGAVLFYVSDVMVARDRFVKSDAWNRWIGLPLYYGGQMVLAYTAGLVLPPA